MWTYKVSLMDAVTTGDFVTLLHAKSGILLERTYDLHFDDYSPTFRPTRSPLSEVSLRGVENMIILCHD